MRRIAILALAAAAAGCGDLQHENPFDPQTPGAQQARASLAGTVALETLGVAPVLTGVHVSVAGTGYSADTDADGGYVIAGVPPGSYTVQAVKSGYDTTSLTGILVTLDDGEGEVPVPPLQLQLARGDVAGLVALRLPDGSFESTGGASVSLSGLPGAQVTDAGGSFFFGRVPSGSYALTSSRVGYETITTSVVVTENSVFQAGTVELPTDPGWIAGSVLVVGGADSGGVTVRASGSTLGGTPWEQISLTDPVDGTFLISGLPAGSFNVTFEKEFYGTVATSAVVTPGMGTDLPAVELARDSGSVYGVATLAGAADHAGIQVALTAVPPPADGSTAAVAVTDRFGNWRVDGLAVGPYTIVFRRQPGYDDAGGTVTVASRRAVPSVPAAVQLAMQPATLTGTVGLEGRAAPLLDGTAVAIEGGGVSGVTDTTGRFTLSDVPAGTHVVRFDRAGFDTQKATVAIAAGQTIDLPAVTLPVSRGGLAGTFALAGLASSGGVVVTVEGPAAFSTVTGADGAFALAALPVGTYGVTARKDPDWQPRTVTGIAVAAGVTSALPAQAALVPVATAALSGHALLEGATDHTGTTVQLSGSDFRGVALTRPPALTGEGGAWSFADLPAGSYQVTFSRTRYDSPAPVGVSVGTGQALDLGTLTLSVSRGVVVGSVALTAGSVPAFQLGSDLSGTVVTLAVPGAARSAVTDAAGGYRFDAVPVSLAGLPYDVTARRPSFETRTAQVTVGASVTATAPLVTLPVSAGQLSGTVLLRDFPSLPNATHLGTPVSVVGTAFNGRTWTAATTCAADGTFSLPSVPPGSYDLVATSTNRACGEFTRVTAVEGTLVQLPPVECWDVRAPTALSLGAPEPLSGSLSGYTPIDLVHVPIVVAAADATVPDSNFVGYQLVVGSTPDWDNAGFAPGQPGTLTFTGLVVGAANTLWARAVDELGNAGPVATVQVISDGSAPATPLISTPRTRVDATTTSVTLAGSEADANFLGYEACAITVDVDVTCGTASPCTFAPTASSFALSLTSGRKTCLYARALDRAGNVSGPAPARVEIVSDLSAPTPPRFLPSYDPYRVAVRAPWVDFVSAGASTDAPGAGGPWEGVAYIEVDTGSGYQALCAEEACRPGGTWTPCGCGCDDDRLLCDGDRFVGVRATLAAGTATDVAFRAVDLAGNVGPGVGQQVFAQATSDVIAASGLFEKTSTARGSLVGFEAYQPAVSDVGMLADLGANRRLDPGDPVCKVADVNTGAVYRSVVPVHAGLVAYAEGYQSARIRRPGADGDWCTTDDVTTQLATAAAGWTVAGALGSGETIAWVTGNNTDTATVVVREPGADRLVGTADDPAAAVVATFGSVNRAQMAGGTILVQEASCGAGCYTYAWRAINAGPTGSFLSGATLAEIMPADGSYPMVALSGDGKALAWGTGALLSIRLPGPNGVFDAADDQVVTRVAPFAVTGNDVAIDGPHFVILDGSSPGSWIVHWWAGADGAWGTADDVVERLYPSGAARHEPSISDGLLTFTSGGDVQSIDLSTFRWEATPAAQLFDMSGNGGGTLFYRTQSGALFTRSGEGIEREGPWVYDFASLGDDLLTSDQLSISHHGPDAERRFFTATALPAAQIFGPLSGSSLVVRIALGAGKAIVTETDSATNLATYRILEPLDGTLRDVPTGGLVVTPHPAGQTGYWTWAAITARQAFYNCDGVNVRVCVYDAGADRRFGTGDDPGVSPARLGHPPGSPLAGVLYTDATYEVSGGRLLVADHNGLFLHDAGADGLFGTPDDRERTLTALVPSQGQYAVAGDWVAYLDSAAPGGLQVHLARGMDGPIYVVTDYYSAKRAVALDPGGRAYWIDAVLAPEGIFVRAP